MLSMQLTDDNLKSPFRNLAVRSNGEPTLDLDETLDTMYTQLKKSYLSVRNETAHIIHEYKEDDSDERNDVC